MSHKPYLLLDTKSIHFMSLSLSFSSILIHVSYYFSPKRTILINLDTLIYLEHSTSAPTIFSNIWTEVMRLLQNAKCTRLITFNCICIYLIVWVTCLPIKCTIRYDIAKVHILYTLLFITNCLFCEWNKKKGGE